MSEQREEFEFDEQPDEGVRNLRNKLKAEQREKAELEQRLAAIEAERETERQAVRAEQVSGQFQALGLPDKMAALYPADAAVSADAVAEWASTYGIAPAPQQAERPAEDNLVESYNRLISQQGSSLSTSESDLGARIDRGVRQSLSRKTMPTQAEREEAERDIEEINLANRRLENEIRAGRASPLADNGVVGYGGRLQPPPWADRAAQARAQQ